MELSKSVLVVVLALGLPMLAEAGNSADPNQAKYRWRNDNGSELSATWKAAENTAITGVRRGDSIRLRFAVESLNIEDITGRVEYAESSTNGPWKEVDASGVGTAAFEMMPTPWYTDGDEATEQITVPNSANDPSPMQYAGGVCCELPSNIGIIPYLGHGAGNRNLEYCFRAGPVAKRNTKYYFRLSNMGNAYPTYTKFAQLTVEDTDPGTAPNIVVAPLTIPGGQPWLYQLYVAGARPMTYNVQGLPAGITRTGTILSGRPTAYGTFPITVTATNASGSDTKVWTLVVSEPATEVIVDDHDLAGVEMGLSGWALSSKTNLAWNGNCNYNRVVDGPCWVRWTPDIPMTTQYDVYARWISAPFRGRHVPYTICHAAGTNEVFVNQRDPALSAKWNLLGRYTFNMGTNGWVELGGNDGQACADAIRFVRVGGASADADGDGMDDTWEVTYLGGTNASPTADEDTDGSNNLSEYLAGTHPKNASSVLAFTAFTDLHGQVMDLTWFSVTGRTYRIEKSTNQLSGFTVTEASGIAATPPINTNAVTLGTSGRGFYRVRLE